ncbi:MAG: ABC transporter substrate-binding protein [Sulfurospirillaceae bacterium]|nr:ABC transporter substrate-binding protein [Sulfurospirillaceae bacterium]MDD2827804.1 ABC transporter substrate-binding protein [Sulfurospirillaceae bacterium]
MILLQIFLELGIDLKSAKFSLFILLFTASVLFANDGVSLNYRNNNSDSELISERLPESHIKVFFPTMPYLYLSKLINGTLVRSSGNKDGWEYMLATSYVKIDPLTYEFTLRQNVHFQDGTPFNADSVIENFHYFQKDPIVYSDIHKRLKSVTKVSPYTVRFHLLKPYGMLLNDLATINLYTSSYLKKFGCSTGEGSQSNCNSMQAPGLYGLGPYILTEGFATGRFQTPIIKLKANPYYYEKGMPYIENITIFTELTSKEVIHRALEEEGALDIAPIPFNKKVETVLSKYARLYTKPSTNNISIYFNMLKANSKLNDKRIRIALNKAINQKNLLNFVYKKEGFLAPTESSVNYRSVKLATQDMKPWGEVALEEGEKEKNELHMLLNGLHLKVVTLERFMFLWRGIEYQLKQYGVTLEYFITPNEKEIYGQLLTNRKSPKDWDILTWGNDDWSSNHPWTSLFAYRTSDKWSSIERDDIMQDYIEHFFDVDFQSNAFDAIVKKMVQRVYDQAYMLFVPSPNIVLAVNKEISYDPSSVLLMPLWKAKLTRFHWSIRGNIPYPQKRQQPMRPLRFSHD